MSKRNKSGLNATLALALTAPILFGGCNFFKKPTRSPYSTAFREWIDGAGKGKVNGLIHLDELIGKSDHFNLKDQDIIRFATRILDRKGDKIHFSLYDQSGDLVLEKNSDIGTRDYTSYFGIETDKLTKRISGNEKYNVVFHVSPKDNLSNRTKIDEYSVTFKNN
jgi:hypothetical protein